MNNENSIEKDALKNIENNTDIENKEGKLNFFTGDFKSHLSANPFSEEGIKLCSALNISAQEDEFFEKYYVDLYDKVDENDIDESIIKENPDYAKLESQEIYINDPEPRRFKSNLIQFENNVKDTVKSILAIKGTAGSGKTTYLRYLNYKYGNSNNNESNLFFHIINFAVPEKRIRFLASTIEFEEKVDDNIWKATILLTKYISMLISGGKEINLTNIYSNCTENIIEPYNNMFNKTSEYPIQDVNVEKFFIILLDSIKTETDDTIGTMLSEFLKDLFNTLSSEKALSFALQVIICFLLCLSRNGKRYICAIDNLEYMLKIEDRIIINDQDIRTIVNKIIEADENFKAIKNNLTKFQNCYSFILVTRISTYTFLKTAHDAIGDKQVGSISNDKFVNTENAVRFEGVVENHIKNLELHDNEYVELFKIILNDKTNSIWCMYSIISKFCNYNYRQIVQQLIDVISTQNSKEIKFFINWWNYVFIDSEKNKQKENRKNILKHLLRKNFLRMILCHYEQSDFFEKIMKETTYIILSKINRTILNSDVPRSKIIYSEYTSYTRKILNIISNYQRNYKKSISLSNLFNILTDNSISESKDFCDLESNSVFTEQINKFVDIILILGNATFEIVTEGNFAFGRCINLDINSLKYTEENIKNNLLAEIKHLNENKQMDNYPNISRITLTSAGNFFCYMLPDFELFSTRYLYADNSLFSRDSFSVIENKNYKFAKIADVICKKAINCMKNSLINDVLHFQNNTANNLVRYDYMTFIVGENNIYKNHSLRIIILHMGYINNYIECLTDCIKNNFFPYKSHVSVNVEIDNLKKVLGEYYDFLTKLINGKYYVYSCEKNDIEGITYRLEEDNFSDVSLKITKKLPLDGKKLFDNYKPNRSNWKNLPKEKKS